MARTVVFAEAPDVVSEWLERRRALGQDGHDEMREGAYDVAHGRHGDVGAQVAEFPGPCGPERFDRTGASTLLDVDEATLHAEIDWPPTG